MSGTTTLTEQRESQREAFRASAVAQIPATYSPWRHLGALVALSGLSLVLLATQLRDVGLVDLFVVLGVMVTANLFEWFVHRYVLHRRVRHLTSLYDGHTGEHHRIYREHDMDVRSYQELRLVLTPAVNFGIVLASIVATSLLLGAALGGNAGLLVGISAALYTLGYELTHVAYHLPASTLIGGLSAVRRLRELHARHHNPRYMRRYNFNVTVPLGDWLFGTLAPKAKRRP